MLKAFLLLLVLSVLAFVLMELAFRPPSEDLRAVDNERKKLRVRHQLVVQK